MLGAVVNIVWFGGIVYIAASDCKSRSSKAKTPQGSMFSSPGPQVLRDPEVLRTQLSRKELMVLLEPLQNRTKPLFSVCPTSPLLPVAPSDDDAWWKPRQAKAKMVTHCESPPLKLAVGAVP